MADSSRKRGRSTHGAFTVLRALSGGTLDHRTRPALALRTICHNLAADLGSTWEDLPTQQRLLAESIALKGVVLGLMTSYALATGVLAPDGSLRSPLNSHFLAWSNSMRLDLQALFGLGLERKAKDVLDVAALLAQTPNPNAD